MKKEDLFEILGDINNQYVKEVHTKNKRKNNFTWAKWGTTAACVALLVIGIPVINHLFFVEDNNIPNVESTPIENTNKVEDLQNPVMSDELQAQIDKLNPDDSLGWIVYDGRTYIQDLNTDTIRLESEQSNIELSDCLGRASDYTGLYSNSDACDGDVYMVVSNPDILCLKLDNGVTIWLGVEDLESSEGKENSPPDNTEFKDVPADTNGEYNEAVNSGDLTKDTSEFFGGSYLDDSGKFVVVLTEDTSENRTAICRELGRNENNTTFVTGTYTLAYLTELQAKISNAMANKELPFVVSSGLYETTNNIVVGVTTTDESELAKVYAFDTLGGAIKIEFSSGATKDLLLVPKAE